MKVAFRVDASLEMGSGHVMRCLTLADKLRDNGADCVFICREHPGNLIEFIQSKKYVAHGLPRAFHAAGVPSPLAHAKWLGCGQEQDADACRPILQIYDPDILVVDHYSLDRTWEEALISFYRELFVIDDLADRAHLSKMLLDQTFGREARDYYPLVPPACKLLCGAGYALLRPEFAAFRSVLSAAFKSRNCVSF
jgi:UDP-2,4-diacetamido-2,4,6-trideoxy-beta-L-altropyranose hydrolase